MIKIDGRFSDNLNIYTQALAQAYIILQSYMIAKNYYLVAFYILLHCMEVFSNLIIHQTGFPE